MSTDSQSIFDAALALPMHTRAELADLLLASLDDGSSADDAADIEAAWIVEAERRLAKIRSGEARTIPGDEVMKKLDNLAGKVV